MSDNQFEKGKVYHIVYPGSGFGFFEILSEPDTHGWMKVKILDSTFDRHTPLAENFKEGSINISIALVSYEIDPDIIKNATDTQAKKA